MKKTFLHRNKLRLMTLFSLCLIVLPNINLLLAQSPNKLDFTTTAEDDKPGYLGSQNKPTISQGTRINVMQDVARDTVTGLQQQIEEANGDIQKINQLQPQLDAAKEKMQKAIHDPTGAYGDQLKEEAKAWQAEEESCTIFNGWTGISMCFLGAIELIGKLFLYVSTWILRLSNYLFSLAIQISIADFSKFADFKSITNAWIIFRDLVNMFFIFLLLYAAAGAVLGLSSINWKDLIFKVVIVALLVNFSPILPKVIIDTTNILAMQVYSNIGKAYTSPDGTVIDPNFRDVGGSVAEKMKTLIAVFAGEPSQTNPTDTKIQSPASNISFRIIAYFGGTVMLLVMAFVLAAGGVMFFARSITLLILIP
ncbi:MAG: hypothetical protein WCO03_01425, partial [bacterium]